MGLYSENIGMKFCIEKYAMLIMKSEKQQMTKEIKQLDQGKKSERSEKRKFTSTWEYWKQTPIKHAEMKENIFKKRILQENEKTTRN